MPPRRSRWEKPQNGSAQEILRPPNGADETDWAGQTGAFGVVQPARAQRAGEARLVWQNGGGHIRQEGQASAVSAVGAGETPALRGLPSVLFPRFLTPPFQRFLPPSFPRYLTPSFPLSPVIPAKAGIQRVASPSQALTLGRVYIRPKGGLLRCQSRFLPRHSRFRGNDGQKIGGDGTIIPVSSAFAPLR